MKMAIIRGAVLTALFLAGSLAASHAQQSDSRMTGIKLDGNEPIEIESDRLEVREAEGVAVFTGNVQVVQGPTLLRSGTMTVYYSQDGGSASTGSSDIDRLEVDGKVYVRSERQVATGDRGTFDMKSETLVLSEGDNVIVGCQLTVQMATGQARLEGCGGEGGGGRVRMLLKPGSQD
jgi:lipopolysaccharide export system protein LptA